MRVVKAEIQKTIIQFGGKKTHISQYRNGYLKIENQNVCFNINLNITFVSVV